MSDLFKRIADYFANDYQGDDKTAPTMEITVNDLRYIANMNVERCRAEAELRNLKYNKCKDCTGCVQCKAADDVCEWKYSGNVYISCNYKRFTDLHSFEYCPYCEKKIKIVGD